MKLENLFAYSHTTGKTFNQCERKWWIEKVLAWEGWSPTSPHASRTAYRLKQMKNVWMLAGTVVHDLAELAIRRAIDENQNPLGSFDLLGIFRDRMRRGWLEAEIQSRKPEEPRPKGKANLEEMFYPNQSVNAAEVAIRVLERGSKCSKNILFSKAYSVIADGRANLVELEDLRQFNVGENVPVWVKIDVGYTLDDGTVWLWDWKTGRPRETDREQLILYALYAMEVHSVPAGDIRLGLCYLLDGTEDVHIPTVGEIQDARNRILEGAAEIRRRLAVPRLNEGPAKNFPKTSDLDVCQRCRQFLTCKGHRERSNPGLDLLEGEHVTSNA